MNKADRLNANEVANLLDLMAERTIEIGDADLLKAAATRLRELIVWIDDLANDRFHYKKLYEATQGDEG